ncbi:MAG: NAD(P)-dependent oxidoreductase [Puia sp.]|nr:NAD(P)-dependent oxidoreductase [Puia sp.]
MKKILVTGATGFIGQYVIDWLLRREYAVIATSSDEQRARLFGWYGKVHYIPFDLARLTPSTDYYSFFGRPDSLIHLAWEGLPNFRSSFHMEGNLPRQAAFLENLVSNGLRDVNVTGTCLEYGMQEGCLREEMPAMPEVAYARAKNELRLLLEKWQDRSPFFLKWIRLFYMYGKGQNPNSLFSQLDRALDNQETVFNMSGGEQIRDYLPVERLAEYIGRIALQQTTGGIINCCSGKPVTVLEMVNAHLETRHRSIRLNRGYYPYPDYEPMCFWGDTEKLNRALGGSGGDNA